MEGVPNSGLILCEKAVQLHKKMYEEESSFSWKHRMAMEALQDARNTQLVPWRWEMICQYRSKFNFHHIFHWIHWRAPVYSQSNFQVWDRTQLLPVARQDTWALGRWKKESHNQVLCRCYRHHQVIRKAKWQIVIGVWRRTFHFWSTFFAWRWQSLLALQSLSDREQL